MALRVAQVPNAMPQRYPNLSVIGVAALRVTLVTQRATQHDYLKEASFHV
jgi:hypothetical protein